MSSNTAPIPRLEQLRSRLGVRSLRELLYAPLWMARLPDDGYDVHLGSKKARRAVAGFRALAVAKSGAIVLEAWLLRVGYSVFPSSFAAAGGIAGQIADGNSSAVR